MAGGWGGFWSSGISPIYGRTGPNFDKYYSMPSTPSTPPEPTFSMGNGSPGGKPSSVGQQIPGAEQWVDPLVQRYFGNPDPVQQLAWQSDTGMPLAWQKYMQGEARQGTDYEQYLGNQYARMKAEFGNASLQNHELAWTDFIASKAQELAERYTQLRGWEQGQNPGTWFAGRRL